MFARILGLDVGTKTVGVSVSDLLGMTAQPAETIKIDSEAGEPGLSAGGNSHRFDGAAKAAPN